MDENAVKSFYLILFLLDECLVMNILFIINVKILVLIKWSYTSLQ